MKTTFEVDISPNGSGSLMALSPLIAIPVGAYYHDRKGLRPPLGIYNVSVSRIASRTTALCVRLEAYMRAGATIAALAEAETLRLELIDYMELAIYAAAEHVDDIESIAIGLFLDRRYERHPAYKALQKEMKHLRRFVSVTANVIKHQQARLRLFTLEMEHAGNACCLHGFFVESVENYVVVPSTILDAKHECFSLPTLLWEIMTFVLGASRALSIFLIDVLSLTPDKKAHANDPLTRAIIAAARLPLYTFGEVSPFSRAALSISSSDKNPGPLRSGLYGSIMSQWASVGEPVFRGVQGWWEGDGVTDTFRLPNIPSVGLSRWS